MKKINVKNLLITSLGCLLPIIVGLLQLDNLTDITLFNRLGNNIIVIPKIYSILIIPFFLLFFNFIFNLVLDLNKVKDNLSFTIFISLMSICSILFQCIYIIFSLYGKFNVLNAFFIVCSIITITFCYMMLLFKDEIDIEIKVPFKKNKSIYIRRSNESAILFVSVTCLSLIIACADCNFMLALFIPLVWSVIASVASTL